MFTPPRKVFDRICSYDSLIARQYTCSQQQAYDAAESAALSVDALTVWYANRLTAPPRLSLNREGRRGTTDDFAIGFLHFSLFTTALWDLANSKPVYSLM